MKVCLTKVNQETLIWIKVSWQPRSLSLRDGGKMRDPGNEVESYGFTDSWELLAEIITDVLENNTFFIFNY